MKIDLICFAVYGLESNHLAYRKTWCKCKETWFIFLDFLIAFALF